MLTQAKKPINFKVVKDMNRLHMTCHLLLLFGFALWAASCAVNPVSGERELMLLSEADEVSLGRQTDTHVVREYGVYDDPRLKSYVNDLCQRLGRLSHRPNLPYRFKVLDASVVNAFAVPGGYVYFTRGILAHLNSEAELAGVMGHEIGHITARHSAQQYSRAQLAQMGMGMGMILSDTFRGLAEWAQIGVGMLFLKFSRDNERQADDLGVEYSTRAGYDATQMAKFFETLERMGASSDRTGLPSWFSTHPNPVDRIGAIQARAKAWQQKLGPRKLKIDRDAYLKQLDGLVFGEDPRQGYVENNVFYHPALRFQFPVPSNWKLNNTPSQVQMVGKRQEAVILFSITSGSSPIEAARKFIAKTEAFVIRSDGLTVNGLSSHRLISHLDTRRGPIRLMSYFIQKNNRIFVFHGFTSQALFQRYGSLFELTMGQSKHFPILKKSMSNRIVSAFIPLGVPAP